MTGIAIWTVRCTYTSIVVQTEDTSEKIDINQA